MKTQPELSPAAVQGRDLTLDVLKGIGIILMVLGHSGAPFERFIYLFHMALFFMASGYLWNDKKVANPATLWRSIWSRVKGLWLPYTLANGCFTLLNNGLVLLGIYPPSDRLTLSQIAVNFVKNLLFAGDTQMGGISWFLRCLFIVSVGHLLLRYLVTRWKYGNALFVAVIILTLAGTVVVNRTGLKLPMGIHTCFCGYTAFLLGMAIRKLDLMNRIAKYRLPAALLCLALLLWLNTIDNIGMGAGNISSLPFFLAASLAGWVLVWSAASILKGPAAQFLSYCGKNSIWIAMLHFLSFKPVAWLVLAITGGDMVHLSDFPVYALPWLWIAYTLAGTLLPMLLCFCVHKLRSLHR